MRLLSYFVIGGTVFFVGAGCQALAGIDELQRGGSGTGATGATGGTAGTGGVGGAGGEGGAPPLVCESSICTNDQQCMQMDPPRALCVSMGCQCVACGKGPGQSKACQLGDTCKGETGQIRCENDPEPDECVLKCSGESTLAPCKASKQTVIVLDARELAAHLECVGKICDDRTVRCEGPHPCFVTCDADNACSGLRLICSDGPCTLECAANACGGETPPTIECDRNSCSTVCLAEKTIRVEQRSKSCSFDGGTCTIDDQTE